MGDATAVREHNQNLVTELKSESAFTCHVSVTVQRGVPTNYKSFHLQELHPHRAGIYRHKAIQQIINETLFSTKADDGIKWAEYYNPFPSVAFALTLTAVSETTKLTQELALC